MGTLDLTKKDQPSQDYWNKRNARIERQSVAKAVCQLYQGRVVEDAELIRRCDLLLNWVRKED